MLQLLTIILSILVFSILVISMGLKKKSAVKITGIMVAVVLLLGSVIYGSCYSATVKEPSIAVVKTVNAIIEMFLGKDSIGEIKDAPLMQHLWFQLCVYAAHILAMYVTISSVLIAVGMRMLTALRLMCSRHGNVVLIYGVNDETLSFSEKLPESEKKNLVFADGSSSAYSREEAILKKGGVLISGDEGNAPTEHFVKKIGLRPGTRCLKIYAISEDTNANLRFSESLLTALEKSGIKPEQTSLCIVLKDEDRGESLLAGPGRYGYGSVFGMGPMDLCARLLVNCAPPYTQMEFTEDGAAAEDFAALIVGFGRTGQAVLRSLLMNGQFEGSRFKAYIVSRDGEDTTGSFITRYPAVDRFYDVKLLGCNAKSREFYGFLANHAKEIKYVVICTGNRRENSEITEELSMYFRDHGLDPVIADCRTGSVAVLSGKGIKPCKKTIYEPSILCTDSLDSMAKVINQWYCKGSEKSAEENWKELDYFGRVSSRACADYVDAFLKAAGCSRESVINTGLSLPESTLENLARSEHLRWCGFHAAMGYMPMPADVYDAREAVYLQQKAAGEEKLIRVGKDTDARLHACMIPWDEIDALSKRESRVTGEKVDYKQIDRDNVLAIEDQLKELVAKK